MLTTLLIGICIVGAVGYSFQVAQTAWVLLGLLFLSHLVRTDVYETTCPKCNNIFKSVRDEAGKSHQFLKEVSWDSAVIAIAICVAVGAAVHYFATAWALLGLIFLGAVMKSPLIATTCPKCGHQFTALKNPDDEDEETTDDID